MLILSHQYLHGHLKGLFTVRATKFTMFTLNCEVTLNELKFDTECGLFFGNSEAFLYRGIL